ncbi:MAG: protein kinase family protein, partial [Chitinophagia bacterium]|nr:protein kinase family protein [Chitinophagia bacterium]
MGSITRKKMPRASPDAATRATAHLKVSMQYKRRGNASKSDAHFGRVLAYGSRSSALAFGVAPAGIEDVLEDCSQNITWTWDKKTQIASGRHGTVRIATLAYDRSEYVVKQQQDSYQFQQEVHALIDLQETKLVPKLHAAWRCEGQGYIVMEKLEPVKLKTGEELERAWSTIGTMLKGIRRRGWMHVDTRGENVMRTTGGSLVFVDFGLGVKTTRDGDGQMYPGHYLTAVLGRSLTWAELETYQEYMYQRNYNPASPGNVCTDPSQDRNARPTQAQVDAYVSAYHQYWRMIGSLRHMSKHAAGLYDKEEYDDAKEVKYNGSDNESTSLYKSRKLTLYEPDTDALFPRGVGGG